VPIVCALVPAFKVEVARFTRPELRERPLIVVDRLERGHALAVDPVAYELGARAQMTLVQASACAREAAIAVDEPARANALWEEILDALDAASPLVEDAEPGVAFLEMRGIEGTPRAWLASVRAALAAAPAGALPFRLGLAPNQFVARAAALVADGTIVRPGAERAFVAPLPLHALDLEAYVIERLQLLGVRTLGELAALPHGPFVRRFGPEAARRHERAGGVDTEPLVPRPRALRVERSLFGEGTAEREEQVLFALRTLVARVADDVALAGKRCGYLRLTLECEDGERLDVPTVLAQPTAQAATMFDLLKARLEGIVLAAPVCGLRLGAERLEEGGTERSLFASSDPDPEVVAVALARIEAALGPGSALRARVTAGHRAETRYAYEAFDARGLVRRAPHAQTPQASSPEGMLAYRVLAPREIGVRLERGRPVSVGGRTVVELAGPWRVDESWWAQALDEGSLPYASDAYDVRLDDGTLWRIVSEAQRWYVRGAYD
jgi:nucleotidyltransferase/DNA polymerase involved in DNA repair